MFAICYFYVDHQLPFFLPPKKDEDGRLIMMSEPMIWMEIQIMMLMTGMVYVVILWMQKYAVDKHEEKCHKKELEEPLMDEHQEGGANREQTDD